MTALNSPSLQKCTSCWLKLMVTKSTFSCLQPSQTARTFFWALNCSQHALPQNIAMRPCGRTRPSERLTHRSWREDARRTATSHLVEEQHRLCAELPDALMAGEPGCVHRAVLLRQVTSERSGFRRLWIGLAALIGGRGGSSRTPCPGGLMPEGRRSVGQFSLQIAVRLLERHIDLVLGMTFF